MIRVDFQALDILGIDRPCILNLSKGLYFSMGLNAIIKQKPIHPTVPFWPLRSLPVP